MQMNDSQRIPASKEAKTVLAHRAVGMGLGQPSIGLSYAKGRFQLCQGTWWHQRPPSICRRRATSSKIVTSSTILPCTRRQWVTPRI